MGRCSSSWRAIKVLHQLGFFLSCLIILDFMQKFRVIVWLKFKIIIKKSIYNNQMLISGPEPAARVHQTSRDFIVLHIHLWILTPFVSIMMHTSNHNDFLILSSCVTLRPLPSRLPLPEVKMTGYWTINQGGNARRKMLCPTETHLIDIKVTDCQTAVGRRFWICSVGFWLCTQRLCRTFAGACFSARAVPPKQQAGEPGFEFQWGEEPLAAPHERREHHLRRRDQGRYVHRAHRADIYRDAGKCSRFLIEHQAFSKDG